MNTPQFSDKSIQSFINAWEADFNETMSREEALIHMRNLDELFHEMYAFVLRRAKQLGISPQEFLDSLPGDIGTSGM